MIKSIYDFKSDSIEPTGFKKGKIYLIEAKKCFTGVNGKDHEFTRLAACVQGLVNRCFNDHSTAIAINLDMTDDFWFNYITGKGKTYEGLEKVSICDQKQMLNLFEPFLQRYGIIAWDSAVPSTANVASTICGITGMVPVRYNEKEGSLYNILTSQFNIPVKMNLAGMFEGAKAGTKITGTQTESSGSPKCDAYLWAIEKYMDKCNPELLAYTPDGAVEVPENPVSQRSDAGSANVCGIPNHDYFIHKQCFFFDLTSYALEAPSDEPDQPLGADAATLKKILMKRYEMAGGKFGMALGFPPWHLKYTTHVNKDFIMDGARLEWHFVELATTMNCGIEADAAHPSWMSNGSLYTNYVRTAVPRGNKEPENVKYDPDTYYFTMSWSGDFDCSPWTKWRVPYVWGADEKRGSIPMTYGYNVNLVDRIPMVFDYIFENQTENDFIVGGEGMGYTIPDALFKGFTGREANTAYEYWTRYPGKGDNYAVRTLPDGDEAYYEYSKPYFEDLKIDIAARSINGFSVMSPKAFKLYNRVVPRGTFMQNTSAGKHNLQIFEGVPYFRIFDMGGATVEDRVKWVQERLKARSSKFMSFGYCDMDTNVGTVSGFKEFLDAFYEYVAKNDPGTKYQYVDINTFTELVRKSGLGTVIVD